MNIATAKARINELGIHSTEFLKQFVAYVHEQGISDDALLASNGVYGCCWARSFEDATGGLVFQPTTGSGRLCFWISVELFRNDNEPFTADIICWPIAPQQPTAVATLMPAGEGADILHPAAFVGRRGRPMHLYKTPLDWLRAGCEGGALLNETGGGHWLRKARGPFLVPDIQFGRSVRTLLGPQAAAEKIFVDARSIQEQVAA